MHVDSFTPADVGVGQTEPLNVRVDRTDTSTGRQVAEVLRTGSHRFGKFMRDAVHVGILVQAAIDALSGGPERYGPWSSRRKHAEALTPIVTALVEFQLKNGVTPAIIDLLQSLVRQTAGELPPDTSLRRGEAGIGERTTDQESDNVISAPQETVQSLKRMGAAVHKKGSSVLPTEVPTDISANT